MVVDSDNILYTMLNFPSMEMFNQKLHLLIESKYRNITILQFHYKLQFLNKNP